MRADLNERLEELHRELEALDSSSIDEETREHLRRLVADVEPLAEDDSRERREAAPDDLRERWNDAVHRFETEHPTLAAAVARISHTLAQMGF